MSKVVCLLVLALINLNCVSTCMKPLMEALKSADYVGCYVDKGTDRDFPNRAGYADDMTPMKCFNMCRLFKSDYIGLQRGNECWCGDTFGIHGKAPEFMCRIGCSGDADKVCGGRNENAVYTGPFNGQTRNMKIEGEDSHLQ